LPEGGNARHTQELNRKNISLTENEIENGENPRLKRVVYLGGSLQVQSKLSGASSILAGGIIAMASLLMLIF
jgi:hypothetical protein